MIHIPMQARLKQLFGSVPDLLGSYVCQGRAMFGLVSIPEGSTDHFWEMHGGGDELLYHFAG